MRMRLLFLRLPTWHLWNANDKVASAKRDRQDRMLNSDSYQSLTNDVDDTEEELDINHIDIYIPK